MKFDCISDDADDAEIHEVDPAEEAMLAMLPEAIQDGLEKNGIDGERGNCKRVRHRG